MYLGEPGREVKSSLVGREHVSISKKSSKAEDGRGDNSVGLGVKSTIRLTMSTLDPAEGVWFSRQRTSDCDKPREAIGSDSLGDATEAAVRAWKSKVECCVSCNGKRKERYARFANRRGARNEGVRVHGIV